MNHLGRWLFNSLTIASLILLLLITLDIWQIMGMNPHPSNPFTTQIGIWSGGNGWVPIWVIACAALFLPIVWIIKRITSS